MSESKHTPWAVYENEVWTVRDDGQLGRPLFISRMRDGISWAPAWPRDEEGKVLVLAAAAPDLLEAAAELEGWISRVLVHSYTDRKPMPENLEVALAKIRAAISRATGADK